MHELSEKEKAEAAKIWRDSYYSCYKGKDMYATENPCDTCTASQCMGKEEAWIKTMQEQKYAKTIGEYLQYVIDKPVGSDSMEYSGAGRGSRQIYSENQYRKGEDKACGN